MAPQFENSQKLHLNLYCAPRELTLSICIGLIIPCLHRLPLVFALKEAFCLILTQSDMFNVTSHVVQAGALYLWQHRSKQTKCSQSFLQSEEQKKERKKKKRKNRHKVTASTSIHCIIDHGAGLPSNSTGELWDKGVSLGNSPSCLATLMWISLAVQADCALHKTRGYF